MATSSQGQGGDLGRLALKALARLLLPVVRILLRYGVPYEAFESVAKRTFVRAAFEEFRIPGRSPTASRVAVLTGMNRKDVGKLIKDIEAEGDVGPEPVGRPARIIAGWRRDPEFQSSGGRPAVLPFEGEETSFWQLVRRYGSDVPARAALDELERVGAVERTKDGRVRLIAKHYLPSVTDQDALAALGSHVPDLIASIEHNLLAAPAERFFQRSVAYDNVPADSVTRIGKRVSTSAQRLLETLDAYLERQDRDSNPEVEGSGRRRVVLGVYYLEHEVAEPAKVDEEEEA